MKSLRPSGSRAWVEIDTKALKRNYDTIRKHIGPKPKLMAVIKSNAYGHGIIECAKLFSSYGADWLGVDTAVEGLLVRKVIKKTPILALGYTLPEKIAEAAAKNISITVSSMEQLKIVQQLGGQVSKLKVHVKVDTGMHRQGFLPEEISAALTFLQTKLQHVTIEGAYTHFAAADNPAMHGSVNQQFLVFKKVLALFDEFGLKIIRHACNSGGTLLHPEAHLDMVRCGIALYGLWPDPGTRAALQHKIASPAGSLASKVELWPALAWKTVIGEVKVIPRDGTIGYGCTEKVKKGTRIAICPVGYWHGYFRSLSSKGEMLVHGKRAKVLGRVSMDMSALDVTHIPQAKTGDEVTILGGEISAEEVAARAGSFNYELVTRINPYTKRVLF
ncbi:MAG: alanine racemase [Parcubacteria group bacterium RIFOXYD2_FULL_52_8]|nr:MAG: alanine racemase [Parcubacteria group bacterium RIFOXYD2_FULL_52_8]